MTTKTIYSQLTSIGDHLYTEWFLAGGEHCHTDANWDMRLIRWSKASILKRAQDYLIKEGRIYDKK
ncbi:MAG TPA: hypothetical protein V6C58_28840 [Allocoleopsis sp.]